MTDKKLTAEQELLIQSCNQDANNYTPEDWAAMKQEYTIGRETLVEQGGETLAFLMVRVADHGKNLSVSCGMGGEMRTLFFLHAYLSKILSDKFESEKFCTCRKCRIKMVFSLMGGEMPPDFESFLKSITPSSTTKEM